MNAIVKWMGIIAAIGIALMYIEYRYAAKKKEGVTATDRMRIRGILWITIFFCGLVGWVMWVSD